MTLDELLVSLGFEYDPEDLKKFKDDISKTTNIVQDLIKIVSAATTAITGLVVASTKASDEQGKLANELGETVETISALQFAQTRAGGSAEELNSSLRALSMRAAETSRGVGGAIETFGILGISVLDTHGALKSTSSLMMEVADTLQGLDRSRQIEFADKLGLGGSVRLLQMGSSEIQKLTREAEALGVTTENDAAIAADFQDSLTDLWMTIKSMSRTISSVLAPILQQSIDQFTAWWMVNRGIIQSKLPEWIDMLTSGLRLLGIAVAAYLSYRLLTHFIALISIMRGVTLSALAMNAAIMLLPILIAAGVAAIAALAEDAKVFLEGGDSFIGEMIKQFPELTKELHTAAEVFGTIADLTMMIFDGWKSIFDMFSGFSWQSFGDVASNLPGFATDRLSAFGSGAMDAGYSFYEGMFGGGSTSSQKIDNVNITVQGSSNPEETANAVYNVFQQTSQDLNSAVDQ